MPSIVIGIDFGSSYSTASWLLVEKGISVYLPQIVRNWPATSPRDSGFAKVPTKIHYDESDPDILPDYLDDSFEVKNACRAILHADKTVIQVVGYYLTQLYDHTLGEIAAKIGQHKLEKSIIQISFAVPTGWDERAKDRLMLAVRSTKIMDSYSARRTQPSFIGESEAAAIGTLADVVDRSQISQESPETTLLVLDVGGTTS
ncbi:hypothetical protein GGS23DRAFT_594143 [Durotheca rogersii]|uniref:uncharacterized protein n=1 Tax=Durotheca rogersii TaxID=419775 RepID=UPI00221FC545|nr:uncharacterized protein GGS23DRAFT_594143 [Durotheca rogersii]KAI5865989.1 hypothetical protein GGS23DRAFT_594143 [Durotheca rogersii]